MWHPPHCPRKAAEMLEMVAGQARLSRILSRIWLASEITKRAEYELGAMVIAQAETIGLNRGAAGGGKKESPRGSFLDALGRSSRLPCNLAVVKSTQFSDILSAAARERRV
jgi:hypothetical protein